VKVGCPALLILFYVAVLRLRKAECSGPFTAMFAICGMWASALSRSMSSASLRSPRPSLTSLKI
jgi:hypothetical protein